VSRARLGPAGGDVVRVVAWVAIATGSLVAALGVAMARDAVLVWEIEPFVLGLFQILARISYQLLGIYLGHDMLELLVGALSFSLVTLGVGILIGQASPRLDRRPGPRD